MRLLLFDDGCRMQSLPAVVLCVAFLPCCGLNNYPQAAESRQVSNRALIDAAKAGDAERVQAALEIGADVDVIDEDGHYADTAVMIAAREGYVDIARRLIAAKADVNHREGGVRGSGETALMYAARRGDTTMVKMLLEAGADVNVESTNGATPLSFAQMNNHDETIQLLLEAGAKRQK